MRTLGQSAADCKLTPERMNLNYELESWFGAKLSPYLRASAKRGAEPSKGKSDTRGVSIGEFRARIASRAVCLQFMFFPSNHGKG